MVSAELTKYGFSNWLQIKANYSANRELVLKLPKKRGVYIIRAGKLFTRMKGESDIIYIGQGVIQHRIQLLLRSYLPAPFRNYWASHTAREDFERIMEELDLRLELSYVLNEEPDELEGHLLTNYRRDHVEPPPLNHTHK